MTLSSFAIRFLVLSLLWTSGFTAAHAQTSPDAAQKIIETTADKLRREQDLKALEEEMILNNEARKKLEVEIGDIKNDRAKLNTLLIDSARRVRETDARIESLEKRLANLNAREKTINQSLEQRRELIIEVLAALQRMGRKPPPAVIVRAEDMLKAVRASLLLGAVVPQLRGETETLVKDLTELVSLRQNIVQDRENLTRDMASLTREQERVTALMALRQARQLEAEKAFGSERERATQLAGQSRNLKELIDRMEGEIGAAARAVEEARKAAEAQARDTRQKLTNAVFRDTSRLAPKVPFTETRGLLPLPVSGELMRGFGAPDGLGGSMRGISLRTRPKAVVSSPSDGWVVFAGPFRSFGQLLIIHAGGGYYLLLAGMNRINVDVGQFVLAGEPVAMMGEAASLSPSLSAVEAGAPVLYVEFRKDGGSIDPSPWWVKSQGEKVRG
jgi:murein hydrolase activator